jgi:hypothetical protein
VGSMIDAVNTATAVIAKNFVMVRLPSSGAYALPAGAREFYNPCADRIPSTKYLSTSSTDERREILVLALIELSERTTR